MKSKGARSTTSARELLFNGLMSLALLSFCLPAVGADFETAVSVVAADYVPAEKMQGPDWSIASEATNDGFENTYTVESRFGTWPARGRLQLESRIREMQALAQLEEVSRK